MFAVYVFCAIAGGGLLVFSLLFGGDGDGGDVDLGTDVDVDVGADFDLDADHGGFSGTFAEFFSLRSLIFFAAFFGIAGLILDGIGVSPAVTVPLAIGIGILCAYLNLMAFHYLKRTESGAHRSAREAEGCEAKVVLPITRDRRGKVHATVRGETLPLIARPFDPERDGQFLVGGRVVVVKVEDGVALVSHLET
ncbi:MAG: hypothetical protein RL885_19870 [Planctomycetota bacterium]